MNRASRPTPQYVILAAGFSTRLRQSKSLARVRGVSLIRGIVRLLAPLAASRIMVVIPPRAVRIRAEVPGRRILWLENSRRASGLSSSVRRGLAAARRSAAVMLLPVDLAHLKRRDLERMIARWRGARRRVIATRYGSHGGAPLIVPRWLYARTQLIRGDRGLKELIGSLPPEQVSLVNLAGAARDIDTPQDLQRARRGPPPR
ncbi:MAG: nucleotidyltransferase family protein [Steroidobacteraceae bacterium]